MAGGSFFETAEYLAARAKAIEYLEDRLMKDVGAEVLEAEVDNEFRKDAEILSQNYSINEAIIYLYIAYKNRAYMIIEPSEVKEYLNLGDWKIKQVILS